MKHRKLRIAWSVFWGLACVFVIALWVRSYWWVDDIEHVNIGGRGTHFSSVLGVSYLGSTEDYVNGKTPRWLWLSHRVHYDTSRGFSFGWYSKPNYFVVAAPHWLIAVVCLVFAALPRIQWQRRFSLRTLLIATTLVAVALGLFVRFTRQIG